MTTTSEVTAERRIYVACLASYNNGVLHGVWIDADQDAEDIAAEVAAMLKASKEPGAEEWAIHDTEGFGNLVGESSTFEEVADLAAALAEHGDAFRVFLENGEAMPDALDRFEEAYCGEWDSERAYAENLADDLGILAGADDTLRNYFDWDAWTRDLFMGDYWYESGHVFRNI